MTYLYHICRRCDEGNLKEGYIRVSSNPVNRWKAHRCHPNEHLKNALERYDDITYNIISEGLEDEMLRMEVWLRPERNLGWNIAEGGGKPPVARPGRGRGRKSPGSRGSKSIHWIGYVKTPYGTFETARVMEDITGVKSTTTFNRCKNPKWTYWTFIDKNSIICTFDTELPDIQVDFPSIEVVSPTRGSKCYNAKLTEEQVVLIKTCLKTPYKGINKELADRYEVDSSIISAIRNGHTWTHVEAI